MTKKELMKIITEVVRKEVKKEVQKIFIKEESSSKLADIIPEVLEPKEEIQYTKNGSLNKSKIEEISHQKRENKPKPKEKKPWYAKEGNATSQEINNMTKKQKAIYIMEGKK